MAAFHSLTRDAIGRGSEESIALRSFIKTNTKDPAEVANELPQSIINDQDMHVIKAKLSTRGAMEATRELLDIVCKGPKDAVRSLAEAYRNVGEKHIALEIEERIKKVQGPIIDENHTRNVEALQSREGPNFHLQSCLSREAEEGNVVFCDRQNSRCSTATTCLPKQDSNDSCDIEFKSVSGEPATDRKLTRQKKLSFEEQESSKKDGVRMPSESYCEDLNEGKTNAKLSGDFSPPTGGERNVPSHRTDEKRILGTHRTGEKKCIERKIDKESQFETEDEQRIQVADIVTSMLSQDETSGNTWEGLRLSDTQVYEKEQTRGNFLSGTRVALFAHGKRQSRGDRLFDLDKLRKCLEQSNARNSVVDIVTEGNDVTKFDLLLLELLPHAGIDGLEVLCYFEGYFVQTGNALRLCIEEQESSNEKFDVIFVMEFLASFKAPVVICINPSNRTMIQEGVRCKIRDIQGQQGESSMTIAVNHSDPGDFGTWLRTQLRTPLDDLKASLKKERHCEMFE